MSTRTPLAVQIPFSCKMVHVRRWLRFSVGHLLLVLLALSLGLGWWYAVRASRQHAAEAQRLRKEIQRLEIYAVDRALNTFRQQASSGELREFEQLLSSSNPQHHDRLLELVLYNLSSDELFALGISASDEQWVVAWSEWSPEVAETISSALDEVGIDWAASYGAGRAGWYVPRSDFFDARRTLRNDASVATVDIKIAEPRLSFRQVDRVWSN